MIRPPSSAGGTIRSLTFLNTWLATTTFTVPAFAEPIETVVVTAERKVEDVQTVSRFRLCRSLSQPP
jgi:hypothetical protein